MANVAPMISQRFLFLSSPDNSFSSVTFDHLHGHEGQDLHQVIPGKERGSKCTTHDPIITGWWLTYPPEKYESQLG